MSMEIEYDFDDFPLSPTGSQSAREYFDSYLKSKEMYASLPNKAKSADKDSEFHSLLKEVHVSRTRNPALYRRKFDANEAMSSFWLSKIRNFSGMLTAIGKVPRFQGLSEDELIEIGKMSVNAENIKFVGDRLLDHGIILVFEKAIPGMKLDGAVFMLESGNPVIGLTLRYPRLDNFWFTLMHELAHVSIHHDLLRDPILDDLDETPTNKVEKQADRLAAGALISRSDWRSCPARYDTSEENIRNFAWQVRVHPAIVAGRLRNELGRYDIFSDIVNEVNTRKVLFDNE